MVFLTRKTISQASVNRMVSKYTHRFYLCCWMAKTYSRQSNGYPNCIHAALGLFPMPFRCVSDVFPMSFRCVSDVFPMSFRCFSNASYPTLMHQKGASERHRKVSDGYLKQARSDGSRHTRHRKDIGKTSGKNSLFFTLLVCLLPTGLFYGVHQQPS